jgi:hypothetical protein
VRNGDGTAHDQGNVQGVDYLSAAPADFAAADQVIGNAVIAAQDGGSDQAEEFLCFGVQGAGFVSLMVQSEETLDAEVAATKDFVVEFGAGFLEIVERVRHGASGKTATLCMGGEGMGGVAILYDKKYLTTKTYGLRLCGAAAILLRGTSP